MPRKKKYFKNYLFAKNVEGNIQDFYLNKRLLIFYFLREMYIFKLNFIFKPNCFMRCVELYALFKLVKPNNAFKSVLKLFIPTQLLYAP